MTDTEALVALNLLPRIGPVRVRRLLEVFEEPSVILGASVDKLQRVEGIGPETAAILHRWQDHADPLAEIGEAAARGISIVTREDDDYPDSLRDAYDPPLLLYVWGKIEPRDRHAIGIVGSRRATPYGRNVTKKFSFQLAAAGFTIVSGLARGVDTTAHEGALAANGRTIAVLGSGLAKLYPPENLGLAEKIADGNGAVVSEFPLHVPPDRQNFPMRNRIVAAWSKAVVVTECPSRSGSIITANLASEYGKTIYAVPGPVDSPMSMGCHELIRDGATLAFDGSHILDDLGGFTFDKPPATPVSDAAADLPPLSEEESRVLAVIGHDESPVDRIIGSCGLPAPAVTATLMKLEMKRLVRCLPGFRYSLR